MTRLTTLDKEDDSDDNFKKCSVELHA